MERPAPRATGVISEFLARIGMTGIGHWLHNKEEDAVTKGAA